jgi:hypothetical protein
MKSYLSFDNIFEDAKFQLGGQTGNWGSTAPQQITPLVFQLFQPTVKIILHSMMQYFGEQPLQYFWWFIL